MPRNYRHIKLYEKEIVELKAQGETNQEISEKSGLQVKQVKKFTVQPVVGSQKKEIPQLRRLSSPLPESA